MADIEKQIDDLEDKYIEELDEKRMKKDLEEDENFDAETMQLRAELRAFMSAVKSYQIIMETQGQQIKTLSEIVDEIKKEKTNPSAALMELDVKYINLDKKIDQKFEEVKVLVCSEDVREHCKKDLNRIGKVRTFITKYLGYALAIIVTLITIIEKVISAISKAGGKTP